MNFAKLIFPALMVFLPTASIADSSGSALFAESVYELGVSICTTEPAAIKVFEAGKIAKELANKVFDALPECMVTPLRFRVGKIKLTETFPDDKVTYQIVELLDITNPEDKVYFLTSMTILNSTRAPNEPLSNKVQKVTKVTQS